MPRGITSKGLATRRRIVEGAAAVVRERGVAATGLEDVRAATGTSGGQLAHYFPGGKGELMLAVTAFEADQILLEQQPLLGDLTSWEAWKTWAAELLERHVQQGEHCGLSVLIGQLDPNDPAVQRIILGMYREWGAALARGIRAMQSTGDMTADADAEEAAAALLAGIQGGALMLVATGSPTYMRAALDTGLEALRATAAP